MMRKFLFAFVVLFFLGNGLFAAEYKDGQAPQAAQDGKSFNVLLTTGKDMKEFKIVKVNDKTKFFGGKDGKEELKDGIKSKEFANAKTVNFKTEGEGDKEVATEVTITASK